MLPNKDKKKSSFKAPPGDNLDRETKRLVSFSDDAGIPPINLFKYKIDSEIIRIIPENIARSYRVIPLARMGSVLTVAMADPFEVFIIDNLKIITGCNIQPVVAGEEQIKKTQDYYNSLSLGQPGYDQDGGKQDKVDISWQPMKEDVFDVEEVLRVSQDASVIDTVNGIIRKAIEMRASDIHIEPYAQSLRLRLRIDGVMQEMEPLPRENANAIIARIKIMSRLDITIRRLPQDGRFSSRFEGRQIDFRVSILPIHFGEKAVLRILDKASLSMELSNLGFSRDTLAIFNEAISRPYGMILLTGPTGSGKSTTIYGLMSCLNTPQKHLVSVEDPVEYQIKGITQIQARPDIGLNFASCLRAVLRQSPDVIMIGEIRDYETVDIAMKSALTGHIILSTLHTNDAPSAIVRLMDMQVEPFLISSTLTLVVAQRLARRVCPHCKQSEKASAQGIAGLPENIDKNGDVVFYRGKGCDKCRNSGYFGRVAVAETLSIDDNIRQMILQRKTIEKIRDYARSRGMRTLREDAIEKGLAGEISLEEVLRVTPT
ncbi:MAG: GspE/PulE family protein [Candidatus Omnitrophota bacterium]